MPYSIKLVQLPIVGGTAGHNYVVLLDGDGHVVSEMNGLATNSQGERIPVGTNSTDMLKVYEDKGGCFYSAGAPQQVVFSGTEAQAMALWDRAQDAMSAMNAMNLSYPPYGFNIFSPTINSNSVASTLLKAMDLPEPSLGGAVTPGAGNIILPLSRIVEIQESLPLPQDTGPAPAGDGGTTGGTSGGTTGGEGGGGGGGGCVAIESLLPDGRRAGDVRVDDRLELADEKALTASQGVVSYSQRKTQPGWRIVTQGGVSLRCSASAPIPTPEGLVLAPQLLGKQVAVRRDGPQGVHTSWEAVESVQAIGDIQVQHITVGDRCFWAGEQAGAFILHHNKDAEPPEEGDLKVDEPDAKKLARPTADALASIAATPDSRAHSLLSAMAGFGAPAADAGLGDTSREMHAGVQLTAPQA